MGLIEDLERALAGEESLFRAQLLREDNARLRKLQAIAAEAADAAAFVEAGMRIGWTQGDARTAELRGPLEKLLNEIYARESDARISAAWHELHRVRMERLLGCLSTPTPRPAG
jgi:hypothetical protein